MTQVGAARSADRVILVAGRDGPWRSPKSDRNDWHYVTYCVAVYLTSDAGGGTAPAPGMPITAGQVTMRSKTLRAPFGPASRVAIGLGIAGAMAVAACDDIENGAGPDPAGVPARVVVSPEHVVHPFSLDTVRLTAQAFDALGEPVADAAFTWTSSDTAVAAVDGTGLVATLRYGNVAIHARAGDAVGSATVIVKPGTPLENECMRCHSAANKYKHVAWGFPATSCTTCHAMDTTPHSGTGNAHDVASGGFGLSGAHVRAACTACHEPETGSLAVSPSGDDDCVTCHLADYQGFHPSGWPTACAGCHTTEAWSGAAIDHESASGGFRLLGAHAALACSSCHDPGTYAPRWAPADDSDCVTCHRPLYDAQHGGSGYPTTCATCHTRTSWSRAPFDHQATSGFPLPSDHADLVCTRCHDPVTFQPLYAPAGNEDCIACHQADYELQHAANGYPTTCLACHTTPAWIPANFDHDGNWFPIFTGRHENRWADCGTCHPNVADFAEFTCFNCHRHNQTSMDNTHSDVSGYTYNSVACYGCHPRGEAP